MLKKRDEGVTLIEVMISMVIISMLVLLTSRMLSTAGATLSKSSEQSLRAQEAMRWIRLVRYDIQGSSDLFVFGSAVPANETYLCSSLRTISDRTTAWNAIGSTDFPAAAGVRSLFTVVLKDVSYTRTSDSAPTFLTPRYSWIGYEIRRAAAIDAKTPYELWRVTCADSNATTSDTATTPVAIPTDSERVMTLGTSLDFSISGQAVIACPTKTGGLTFCPDAALANASPSTSSIPWYSLSLPLSEAEGRLINRDASLLLNQVARMVNR